MTVECFRRQTAQRGETFFDRVSFDLQLSIDEPGLLAWVNDEHAAVTVENGRLTVMNLLADVAQPDDGHQFKFHAPGVGVVRVEGRGGVEQETLVLTKLRHLDDKGMAEARDTALGLDERAYDLARDVWSGTPHATVLEAP